MTTQVPDTVTSMLMRALSDPGSITERKTLHVDWDGTQAYESLTAWQARAVLEIVPPLIARAERERIRQGLMERQATLAYVSTGRQVNAVLVRDIEHVLDGPL